MWAKIVSRTDLSGFATIPGVRRRLDSRLEQETRRATAMAGWERLASRRAGGMAERVRGREDEQTLEKKGEGGPKPAKCYRAGQVVRVDAGWASQVEPSRVVRSSTFGVPARRKRRNLAKSIPEISTTSHTKRFARSTVGTRHVVGRPNRFLRLPRATPPVLRTPFCRIQKSAL